VLNEEEARKLREQKRREVGDRLARGHQPPTVKTKIANKRRRRAEEFSRNESLERLIEMRSSDPTRFAQVTTPTLRMQLGFYQGDRTIAIEEGLFDPTKGGSDGG
jgi:hypothetical protein